MTAATHDTRVQPALIVAAHNATPLTTPRPSSTMTTTEEVARTLSDLPSYMQRRPPSPTSTVTPEPLDTLVSGDEDLSESALATGSVSVAAHATTSPRLTKKSTVSALSCSNCGTNSTPLWRRNEQGQSICNACGLYYRAYGKVRPYWLKRNNGRKRGGTQEGKGGKDAGRAPSTEDTLTNTPVHPVAKSSATTPASPEQPATADPATTTGTCPGDGHCNGTGGSAACGGCPAFNQTHMSRLPSKCFNCQTDHTPLWRRDAEGNTICNACGLYYKLHNVHRPVHMRRNVIKRRKRAAHSATGKDSPPSESRSPTVSATAHSSQGFPVEPQSQRPSSVSVSPILPLAGAPGDLDVPPVSVPRAMVGPALPNDVPAIEDTLPRRKRSYGHMNAASVNIQIDDSYTRYSHHHHHLHDALQPPPAKLPALVSSNPGHGLDRPLGGIIEERASRSSDRAAGPMTHTRSDAPRRSSDHSPAAHLYPRPPQASPRDERYHHHHTHDPLVPGAGVNLPPIRDPHPSSGRRYPSPGSDAHHPSQAPAQSHSLAPLGDSLAAYAHDTRGGASYAAHHAPGPMHQLQGPTSSPWPPQDAGRLALNREEMMLHRQELRRENERLQALLSRTASMIHELDYALQDSRGSEVASSPPMTVARSSSGINGQGPASPPTPHPHHHPHHPQDYAQPPARRPSSHNYSSPPSPIETSASPGQQHPPRPHLPSLRNILPNPSSPLTAATRHGPLTSSGSTSRGISSRS